MPLLPGYQQNFQTLCRAAQAGDCALLDCQLIATGEPVAVICAANRRPDEHIEFVPLAMLFNDDPYQIVVPPQSGQDGAGPPEDQQHV